MLNFAQNVDHLLNIKNQLLFDDPNSIVQDKNEDNELEKLEYLEKLASLRDKGIISDDEFENKKKDILKI